MSYTVERVDLYLVRLPLVHPFTTSSHTKDHLEHIILRVRAADGAEGWGECASPSDPYYCAETVETCWHIIRDFLSPALLGRAWDHPEQVGGLWAKVRGNNFAKAGIEMACWDLFARATNISVARALGGEEARPFIESGVSLGIEATPALLLEQVDKYVAQGYKRIKMKIGPGHDVEYVAAVRAKYPDLPVMADANSVYTLRDAPILRRLDRFNLMMIEQPLGDDDIVDHAALQKELQTPICLDESIHSVEDARKALDLDAGRIINIKVSRLGGLAEAKRTHDLCRARGIPVWCGGMHEFGVGRAANIAINSLPGFTLPGDVSGSDKAYKDDIVEPPIRAHEGRLPVPLDRPGLGHDVVESRIRDALVREESIGLKVASGAGTGGGAHR
ncbi:MAG: o-succinylbenzoate synthase [Chloroflexi bacterium]|nr:o-succinylbenzoate synthase [Chloroflexota bacterium]